MSLIFHVVIRILCVDVGKIHRSHQCIHIYLIYSRITFILKIKLGNLIKDKKTMMPHILFLYSFLFIFKLDSDKRNYRFLKQKRERYICFCINHFAFYEISSRTLNNSQEHNDNENKTFLRYGMNSSYHDLAQQYTSEP